MAPGTPAVQRTAPTAEKKVAIIGPAFFSYVKGIVAEFERRGIETIAFDERHSNRVIDKVLYRTGVYHGRFSPKHRHLSTILNQILTHGCTDVMLVDVEAVDRNFVERLNAAGLRVHLYMWDGIRNKPGFAAYLDIVASKGTFDPVDAKTLDMRYIPLFAEPVFDERALAMTGPYRYDIGFCGTVHSSRSRIIARLLNAPWARRRNFAFLLYYHSRKLFLIKAMWTWSVWRIAPLVTDKPFSKAEIAKMFAESRFILDVPHHGQTGMTARTFEVLMAGARLLTFNSLATELLPASLRERVVVINHIDEARYIDFDNYERMPPLRPEERYFLSLERFVDELMALSGLQGDDMAASPKEPLEPAAQRSAG